MSNTIPQNDENATISKELTYRQFLWLCVGFQGQYNYLIQLNNCIVPCGGG